ncbi:MAG: lipopolysaccharide biosynthesis protein [Bacteroidaceae bacterium]
MPDSSLKDKTAKGLLWGGLNNGLTQLLNLVFGIFLARILTPEDYGMVAMLTVFSSVAATLQDSGFTIALANKATVEHRDYNAVFWFSILVSAGLYGLLFWAAPSIARFYGTPQLSPLARYAFLGFFIVSLGVAQGAYLFRHLMVRQKAISSVVALIVSGVVGVWMAYAGWSYWAIATQTLVYVSLNVCGYWYFSPWRPSFHIDFRPLRGMVGFSSKLLFTQLFTQVNNNLFSIVLGRFYTEREVGYFGQANKWNLMGHSLVSGMVNGVAQPVLAQVADDAGRQVRVFRKMLRFTAFVSCPCMFGLSLVAPELITIAVTDKWAASASILRVLCVGGAFIPMAALYGNLLLSKGRSDWYMGSTVALGLVQLGAMLVAYPYGILTMAGCYVGIQTAWLFVWHGLVWRLWRLSLWQVLKDVVPYVVIAAGVMGMVHYATLPLTQVYGLFLAKVAMAVVLYVAMMWLTDSVIFQETWTYVRKRKTF